MHPWISFPIALQEASQFSWLEHHANEAKVTDSTSERLSLALYFWSFLLFLTPRKRTPVEQNFGSLHFVIRVWWSLENPSVPLSSQFTSVTKSHVSKITMSLEQSANVAGSAFFLKMNKPLFSPRPPPHWAHLSVCLFLSIERPAPSLWGLARQLQETSRGSLLSFGTTRNF